MGLARTLHRARTAIQGAAVTAADRGTPEQAGASLRVRVLLFARAAELVGARQLALRLPPGSSVQDLWIALRAQAPSAADALAPLRGQLALARNQRYARGDEPLADGDELAVIPPVSGG